MGFWLKKTSKKNWNLSDANVYHTLLITETHWQETNRNE